MLGELAKIYSDILLAQWVQILSGVVACLALVFFEGRLGQATDARRNWVRRGGVFLLMAVALGYAWEFAWLGDDAYISFRYARNFARGLGLVFNPGEWVEGFTNFLWTFILGCLNFLGAPIPHTALLLNLLTLAGLVWVTDRVVYVSLERRLSIPAWSAIGLSVCAPIAIYGTSGLETLPGALCVVIGILFTLQKRYRLGALFFVFGAMMRPDHILFWGCMGLALAFEDVWSGEGSLFGRLDWRRYLNFTIPLVAVFVPYFAFRAWLYGDLFPNTYYAKSGALTYFRQGGVYLIVFLAGTGGLIWLPLWMLSFFQRTISSRARVLKLFSFFSVLIFGTYVAKVGGDFMEHRFLLVLLPIVFATTEIVIRQHGYERGMPRWLVICGVI